MRYLIIGLMFLISGCAGLQSSDTLTSRLAVQYATLKVIESSGKIDAADVIEQADKVRAIVTADIDISLDNIISQIDISGLSPADQLLVGALFNQIEWSMRDVSPEPSARVVRILTLLDWIESAAAVAG